MFKIASLNPLFFVERIILAAAGLCARNALSKFKPSTSTNIGVLPGIFMALRAMGLLGISRWDSVASEHIRSCVNRLKVGGIHAKCIPAKMIKLQPLRDWAAKKLITKSVSIKACSRLGYGVDAVIYRSFLYIPQALRASPKPTGLSYLDVSYEQFSILLNEILHKLLLFNWEQLCKRK